VCSCAVKHGGREIVPSLDRQKSTRSSHYTSRSSRRPDFRNRHQAGAKEDHQNGTIPIFRPLVQLLSD